MCAPVCWYLCVHVCLHKCLFVWGRLCATVRILVCVFLCVCACVLVYMYMQPVCVCLRLRLYHASVFARVSVTLMFSRDLQWTFELELRADFPRDDPAPYNPLCVTDHFLLQYCPALYESLFFCFSFDSARRVTEKDLLKAITSKFLLLDTFPLLLVIIRPRKWESVVDCVRLCPEGSCFLVIYAPRVNHCSKRKQETLSNCKSICVCVCICVYLFCCIISFCRRYCYVMKVVI